MSSLRSTSFFKLGLEMEVLEMEVLEVEVLEVEVLETENRTISNCVGWDDRKAIE